MGFYFLLKDLQIIFVVKLDFQALLLVVVALLGRRGVDRAELMWGIKSVGIIKAGPTGFRPATSPTIPPPVSET
jgi:hypothetical protein